MNGRPPRRRDPVHAQGGVLRFARYAHPPNALGHCGPTDHEALLEHVDERQVDGGLVEVARAFAGAWPYLQLIAACAGIEDPLDESVVTAYWLGNGLLDRVPPRLLAAHLDDRFRNRTPGSIEPVVDPVLHGGVAHHSLHVLAVYPWIGLLRSGVAEPALRTMERCLVRWGWVATTAGDSAEVVVPTLAWDGRRLSLGPRRAETFRRARAGRRLCRVEPGDHVAVHWEWVCDRLTPGEQAGLAAVTGRNLAALDRSRPRAVAPS